MKREKAEQQKMTKRGKIIWRAMCRYMGEQGIMENALEYFANSVVPIGAKTLRRRLNDDNWMHKELVSLQQTLKNREVQEDILRDYNEAMNI